MLELALIDWLALSFALPVPLCAMTNLDPVQTMVCNGLSLSLSLPSSLPPSLPLSLRGYILHRDQYLWSVLKWIEMIMCWEWTAGISAVPSIHNFIMKVISIRNVLPSLGLKYYFNVHIIECACMAIQILICSPQSHRLAMVELLTMEQSLSLVVVPQPSMSAVSSLCL